MRRLSGRGRSAALGAVVVVLLALFAWVVLRAGPLAPVPVTAATVETRAIAPALFGIGIVESRYTTRIGPTLAGRLARVDVQVGDVIRAGQSIGEMDPVDLDQRIGAQQAAQERARAGVAAAEAQLQDLSARRGFAGTQARRYEKLLAARANLEAARHEFARARAEREAMMRQRANLRLVAPVGGLVAVRAIDAGTTVVAGQAVVEIVDPGGLWVNLRLDQLRASGLRAGLPARVAMRSRPGEVIAGTVLRVEPVADAVTEEVLAKVTFDALPQPLPAIGELAEVTVELPGLAAAPVVPNASVRRVDGRTGVWVIDGGALRFAPLRLGASDLDGRMQVLEGLKGGERIVVHSQRALDAGSRIDVVERLPGLPS